jgi:hypothetical protein
VSGAFEVVGKSFRQKSVRVSAATIELASMASFFALVVADLCLPYINISILYAIPFLVAIGASASCQRVWVHAAVFIAGVYLAYAIKYSAVAGLPAEGLLSFRLLNRTFVAIALALLGLCATAWQYWQHERLLLSNSEKGDEDEVNVTAGIIACVGIGLVLAAADLLAPARFNLPILLLVPLYLVSWQENQRSLWGTAAAMILLTWLGYFLLAAPSTAEGARYLTINRLVVSMALAFVAGLLSWRIAGRKMQAASR